MASPNTASQSPTQAATTAPAQTCLKLAPVNSQGRALGLLPGDLLVRLDGQPLEGPAAQLIRRVNAQSNKTHLLNLSRDGQEWSVLSATLALGRWKAVEGTGPVTASRARADRMRNWDVMVNDSGRYDTHPQTPPFLAVLAPVYLVQMRLWAALAVWGALTLLGLAIGWVLGAAIQILVCLYVWRAAPTLFRADRHAQGFQLWRVIAATSEKDLHRQVSELAPSLSFVFARQIKVETETEEAPAS